MYFNEPTYVLGGRDLQGLLEATRVGPEVLEATPGGHGGTRALGAELGETAEEKGDFLVELDGLDGQPLVEHLALGQSHGHLQVADLERVLGDLLESRSPALGRCLRGFGTHFIGKRWTD